MARQQDEETSKRRAAIRDRVKFLLEYHWSGNQHQMARDMGVSQGLISKITSGFQGAGNRFLAALSRQPEVNRDWLLRGVGQPLSLPPKGTLPVANGVLPGAARDYAALFTGQRHPIAEALDRTSRYWLELQSNSPLLQDAALGLMAMDLLLMETDPAWLGRPDFIDGRLCGARLNGTPEPAYALGRIVRDTVGLIFDAVEYRLSFAAIALSQSPSLTALRRRSLPNRRGRMRCRLPISGKDVRFGFWPPNGKNRKHAYVTATRETRMETRAKKRWRLSLGRPRTKAYSLLRASSECAFTWCGRRLCSIKGR